MGPQASMYCILAVNQETLLCETALVQSYPIEHCAKAGNELGSYHRASQFIFKIWFGNQIQNKLTIITFIIISLGLIKNIL
ncbi:MAG: hypothetical protein ACLFPQ_04890 [Candidatus Woesearchaeota archaeon]